MTTSVHKFDGRRWVVPGEALHSIAVGTLRAFEALRVAAAAAAANHETALVTALQRLHSDLDLIFETTCSVVAENATEPKGHLDG